MKQGVMPCLLAIDLTVYLSEVCKISMGRGGEANMADFDVLEESSSVSHLLDLSKL